MSDAIEERIAAEDWEAARRLIQAQLVTEPESHWLLTRLSLTYYEQRDYQRALELVKKAFSIAPRCPLVLWDYAGTLEMLDRADEALTMYQHIIKRGVQSLAFDPCGEGIERARGLYADSLYRMSHCYLALGSPAKAIEMLRKHLQQRSPDCQSIYPIEDIRKELRELRSLY